MTFFDKRNQVSFLLLQEDVSVTQHWNYLGDAKTAPKDTPFHAGVFYDEHNDNYYHIRPNGSKMTLKNENSAEMYSEVLKRSFHKELRDIDDKMDVNFHSVYNEPHFVDAIRKYTYTDTKINHKLMSGQLSDEDRNLVHTLNASMHHVLTPEPMTVYSGMSKGHSMIMQLKDVVHHPSFISTSTSPKAASDFASKYDGDMVEIHVPENHPGVWAHPISKHHEHEFLLPSGLNLRIHRDKEKVMILPNKRIRVHYATIEGNK